MSGIKVVEKRCPKNHVCPLVQACPKSAVSQENPFVAPRIDKTKCTNCGACTFYCAFGAFEMSMN